MKNEEYIEIELDEDEQRNTIKHLIKVGSDHNIHPIKFVFALLQLAYTICETEKYNIDDLLRILNSTDFDHNLH